MFDIKNAAEQASPADLTLHFKYWVVSLRLAGHRGLGVGVQMPTHLQNSYSRMIFSYSPIRLEQMGCAISLTRGSLNGPPMSLPTFGEPSVILQFSIIYRKNVNHVVYLSLHLANFLTRLLKLTKPSLTSSNVCHPKIGLGVRG